MFVGGSSLGCSWRMGITLLAFFGASSRLTQFREELKDVDESHRTGGQRDWQQVCLSGVKQPCTVAKLRKRQSVVTDYTLVCGTVLAGNLPSQVLHVNTLKLHSDLTACRIQLTTPLHAFHHAATVLLCTARPQGDVLWDAEPLCRVYICHELLVVA